MAQLPVEITHSLRFLNNFIGTVDDLYSDITEASKKINGASIDNEHYGRDLRKIANDTRKHADDAMELLKTEYQIFNQELTDIIAKKNDEDVIYSLHSFVLILNTLEKDEKRLGKFITDIDHRKDSCVNDKDFIRVVAYNKVIIPLYRFNEMMSHITGRLKTLTGKKD